jgi:SRSO17 transposase
MSRSNIDDVEILSYYQSIVAKTITSETSEKGMLSVDGCDSAKKSTHSAGVGRQYCGTLGKVENCQAGVFCAYANIGGYAIVQRELYFQQKWFGDDFADLRQDCGVPDDKAFQTKNEIALTMIQDVVSKNLLGIKWIGCDSAFGCDHNFLDSLPDNIPYFASVKSNERVFSEASAAPIKISKVTEDESIPWQRVLFNGSKGATYSDVKIVRAISSRTIKEKAIPHTEIWIYIRKHPNGDVKYFISNASKSVTEAELHEAATLRWPIEQCFLECKSNLGMDHFEGRTYNGLLRHWLFVMIAHFFATSLRLTLKKTIFP